MTPQRLSEQELPQPFRNYWFGKRLDRPYTFYLVDGELYIDDPEMDSPGLMHHWTLNGCGGIGCFMRENGIQERRDLPFVSTTGVCCFEVVQSGDYETSVRDPKTGQTWVVHSG